MRNENTPKSSLTLVAFKVLISIKNVYTNPLLSQKNKLYKKYSITNVT